jgi:hypothetical protein
MVKEDLWDLGEKWKTLSEKVPNIARPNEAVLDSTMTQTNPKNNKRQPTENAQLLERMAGDKSVALFWDTFGHDLDSDDELDAATLAAEAATTQKELTGAQFVFSTTQLARDHEKAL